MADSNKIKENFSVHYKYEPFYTGGKIQYSQDGKYMFCKCGNSVKVLSIDSGIVLHTIKKDDEDELLNFVVAPDDSILVISTHSSLLHQWDLVANEWTRTWKSIHSGPISCMNFDSTSTLLATGGSDSTLKIWDTVKQYCTHNLKGAQGVFSVVNFHPDIGRLLVFGSANDCALRVWNLKTSRCIHVFEGHYSTITCLQFSSDGNTLLTASRDKVVILWDIQEFKMKKTIPVFESLESLLLMPQGVKFPVLNITNDQELHFISVGQTGLLRVWQVSSGSVVYSTPEPIVCLPQNDSSVTLALTNAVIVPTLNVLSFTTYEHNVLLYTMEDLTLKKQFVGYNDDILDIQFMGEENKYIAVATNSIDIKVFELSSFTCILLKGHTDIVLNLCTFKKNPLILASSSKDNSIRMWHLYPHENRGECIAIAQGHTKSVGAIATSLLGLNYIVSAGQDTTLKVWNLPESHELLRGTKSIKLKTRFTEIAHEKDINSVAVAPNDRIVASGSEDKNAKLWDVTDGKLLGVFRGHRRGIWCVQFSPVDQVLGTSSADTTIRIWNLVDFSCVKTFEGHDSSVLKFSFLTKGMQLLSSGSDGLLKLWTIKTNECIKTFDEHLDKVWALSVNSNCDFAVTGGADSTIILWRDVTKEEQENKWAKDESLVLQEQKLSNLLKSKKFYKALVLAITLNQPFRALNIIKEIIRENGNSKLEETIDRLREDQKEILIQFITTWNTNSKHCCEAQLILNIILRKHTPDELLKYSNIKESVEGLLPYTERHAARLESLVQQAMILEYSWQCMKLSQLNT